MARVRRWIGAHSRLLLIALLVFLTLFAYAAPSMVTVVPPGHGGVLWRALGGGTTHGMTLREGVHVIAPWNRVFLYDLRHHEETRTYSAIAGNGLSIEVDIGFIYHLRPDTLGNLHQKVGPDYLEVLLMSQIGTVARDSIARWPAAALYGPERSKVEADIFNRLVDRKNMNNIRASNKATPAGGRPVEPGDDDDEDEDYFELDNVMIREVTLPEQVQSAIRRKIEQQEMVQEYEHRLARERLESERKAVEAEGVRRFQETVQQGISDTYLAWRGIEATLQLATSNNAKVVVIGNNSHGLPIIFNTGPDAGNGISVSTAPPGGAAGGTAGTEPSPSPGAPVNGAAGGVPPPVASAAATPLPRRKPETEPPPERAPPPEQVRKGMESGQSAADPLAGTNAGGEDALLSLPYFGMKIPQPFR